MQGTIFDIKRFAIHDGPGIRTTVFFKGCPLKCVWCHNPEGISQKILRVSQKRKLDDKTYYYTKTIGEKVYLNDLMAKIEKDEQFFLQSQGGVTFSGGEPLSQAMFLSGIIKSCKKRGFHVAVDTSGMCTKKSIEHVVQDVDLFLFDIKFIDPQLHKKYTGASNASILSNFELLLDHKSKIIVRVPLIPGITDTVENLAGIKKYLEGKATGIEEIHLLPFHNIGKSKYQRLNIPYELNELKSQSCEELEHIKKGFSPIDSLVKIGSL